MNMVLDRMGTLLSAPASMSVTLLADISPGRVDNSKLLNHTLNRCIPSWESY